MEILKWMSLISVGYRVKSAQGTQFRIWATQRLRDYIIKGFALNDERFKTGSSMINRSFGMSERHCLENKEAK
jgi:hypothetical protein